MELDLPGVLNVLADKLITKTDIAAKLSFNRRKKKKYQRAEAWKENNYTRNISPFTCLKNKI